MNNYESVIELLGEIIGSQAVTVTRLQVENAELRQELDQYTSEEENQ